MDFVQIIPFYTSRGGSAPNMCLSNVIQGYGIPPKYLDAWSAWENTQQHTDDIPMGVDVPIFFSYFAAIDTVYKNWGHVGVRLSNGQFWSDGKVYNSISDYTSNHYPKYVGWGESINDIKVIKQGEDMPNSGDVDNAYLTANGRVATDEEKKVYTSKPWSAPDGLYYGKVLVDLKAAENAPQAGFVPVTEQLYKKG